MADNRVYLLGRDGKIDLREDIKASDDADALWQARALSTWYGAEVWCGTRLVGRVPSTSKPWMTSRGARSAASALVEPGNSRSRPTA